MNLLMIPFHDWKKCEREGFRTRDAHFMQEFGKHPQVDKLLVVNRPISISEIILLRRSWRAQQGRLLWHKPGVYLSQVAHKTYTLDIIIPEIFKPLRMRRHWTPYIFGHPRVVSAIEQTLTYMKMSTSYAAFLSAPLFVPLITQLPPPLFFLDAQDNLLKHTLYQDTPKLEQYYTFCQSHADLISTNSMDNARWLAEKRPDVMFIPNGVDTQIFNPSVTYTVPADLASISRPIVGYAGKMQEMIDVVLMEYVMSKMPEVNFVFIGQQLNSQYIQPLWKHSNAYFLGDKPYHALPQYLAAFDICIIPYHIERQHGGDPIKFYEYLAMGKPIVTTNIGNVTAFRDYPQVCVAETANEFATGLTGFSQQLKQGYSIPTRPVPTENLWQTKAEKIIMTITQKLNEKKIKSHDNYLS